MANIMENEKEDIEVKPNCLLHEAETKFLFTASWGDAGASLTKYEVVQDSDGSSGCTAYITDIDGVEVFVFKDLSGAKAHFRYIAGQEDWRKTMYEQRRPICNERLIRDDPIF